MLRTIFSISSLCAFAVGQQPPRCDGAPNTIPPYEFVESNLTFVKRSTNGLKFLALPSADFEAPVTVLHVYGSQYDMGFAYGSLMAAEISTFVPEVIAYAESAINASTLPPIVKEWVEKRGAKWALEMTYNATKPYTPAWHEDTLRGIADGSGQNFSLIASIAMIPELIKASCSMAGASGKATQAGRLVGGLVQLRALDWTTSGPFQKAPVLITWHPLAGNGHAFTSLTWAGMLGAMTGASEAGLGVSEKVMLDCLLSVCDRPVFCVEFDTRGAASVCVCVSSGVSNRPFTYRSGMLTRALKRYTVTFGRSFCKTCFRCASFHMRLLCSPLETVTSNSPLSSFEQFDVDTDQALSRIATANRTCSIWIGLGDASNTQFKIIGYSDQLVNIYNDKVRCVLLALAVGLLYSFNGVTPELSNCRIFLPIRRITHYLTA
jgi:hypothetical protein